MNTERSVGTLILTTALSLAAWAQQPGPHIGYVYPAGGQRGTTFEVTVGGQFLNGVDGAVFTGDAVTAAVVGHTTPMKPAEFRKLREEVDKLRDKKKSAPEAAPGAPWTPEDQKRMREIGRILAAAVRRPITPAISELVTLQITIAENADVGDRELRLRTPRGLTEPLVFTVDQLPEYAGAPAKVPDERQVAKLQKSRRDSQREAPKDITLPAIVNGQITPGGVDRYRFQASKGQHIIVSARARGLIPYISDAVPGWFEAAISLLDSDGAEVEYADHFDFRPDPVLHYQIPEDGEFTLSIRDSIYRGREDFVYRVTVGELPYVTGIFPLGGTAGVGTPVEMRGWNLASPEVVQRASYNGPGIHRLSARVGDWVSNSVPFAVDTLPELREKEPNNRIEEAQTFEVPFTLNGRISNPEDQDVIAFKGRAGEEIVAEVLARRLDSPLDSMLRLTDAAGKQLAANDDWEDAGMGLVTHHADSRISVELPADGTYYLHLGDTQQKGGPEHAYRLRVSPPRPDFELRVVPSTINVPAGRTVPITVFALRRDGFEGDIALRLKGASPGFRLSGGWAPAGQDKVQLTLTAPPTLAETTVKLGLEGVARIGGEDVRRTGVPAEHMMQAFLWRHLVPAQEWLVRIPKGGKRRFAWQYVGDGPVRLPAGGSAPARVFMPLGKFASEIQFELSEPPEGILIDDVATGRQGVEIRLKADAATVKPGLKGNLIVDAFIERAPRSAKGKSKTKRKVALGTLPAIPFEIVGRGVRQE